MQESFNPDPKLIVIEILLIAFLISAMSFYLEGSLGDLLVPVLGGVWALSIALIALAHFLVRFDTLKIDESSLSHTVGILSTKRVVLPFNQITESKYKQSILQRVLGLGDLHVDSAGGSAIAIDVKNLRWQDLERILSEMGSRVGGKGRS